jgi:hypothetical protein
MKKINNIAYAIIMSLTFQTSLAQSVGIGTSTPDPSARLQISSSNQGILIPAQTAAQRSAISHPATGLLVFQTDGIPGFYYFTGAGWVNLTTGHSANTQGVALSRHHGLTMTLAGNGTRSSEDGQGTAATFNFPAGVAVDAAGNVYVADQLGNRIRKITTTGLVSTYAGTGIAGSDNGPRGSATFNSPFDVALDVLGNLYVADRANNKIRKISFDGEVTTLAGSDAGFADGPANTAMFNRPSGIDVDAAGNVYVADESNHRIRKITTATGQVSTLAGTAAFGFANGAGNVARFRGPVDVAVDANGNLYVADVQNNMIRKINLANEVSTFAGKLTGGAEDGVGADASFDFPHGVAVDLYGNIYVADRNNDKIRKITPDGAVSTLSGTGSPGAADGHGVVATFLQPVHLTTDAFGDVYVADYVGARIRKIIAQ